MAMSSIMSDVKKNGERTGNVLLILGFGLLVAAFIISVTVTEKYRFLDLMLVGLAIGSFSLWLGFTAIGMAYKTDERHTQLLGRIDKSIAWLPLMFSDDILSPSGILIAKERASEQSKEAAQKRLDEDTNRVGYIRGEIYETEGGSWAISWGGKYRL